MPMGPEGEAPESPEKEQVEEGAAAGEGGSFVDMLKATAKNLASLQAVVDQIPEAPDELKAEAASLTDAFVAFTEKLGQAVSGGAPAEPQAPSGPRAAPMGSVQGKPMSDAGYNG